MITLRYDLEFNYRPVDANPTALNQPVIPVTLIGASGEHDTIALLDSGAERCLFKGELARFLGIEDVTTGKSEPLRGLGGGTITGYFHPIGIRINDSEFDLSVGFTMDQIAHNILGRSFFEHVQFGLREHHQKIYLAMIP